MAQIACALWLSTALTGSYRGDRRFNILRRSQW
jgi:hypothetical protein